MGHSQTVAFSIRENLTPLTTKGTREDSFVNTEHIGHKLCRWEPFDRGTRSTSHTLRKNILTVHNPTTTLLAANHTRRELLKVFDVCSAVRRDTSDKFPLVEEETTLSTDSLYAFTNGTSDTRSLIRLRAKLCKANTYGTTSTATEGIDKIEELVSVQARDRLDKITDTTDNCFVAVSDSKAYRSVEGHTTNTSHATDSHDVKCLRALDVVLSRVEHTELSIKHKAT